MPDTLGETVHVGGKRKRERIGDRDVEVICIDDDDGYDQQSKSEAAVQGAYPLNSSVCAPTSALTAMDSIIPFKAGGEGYSSVPDPSSAIHSAAMSYSASTTQPCAGSTSMWACEKPSAVYPQQAAPSSATGSDAMAMNSNGGMDQTTYAPACSTSQQEQPSGGSTDAFDAGFHNMLPATGTVGSSPLEEDPLQEAMYARLEHANRKVIQMEKYLTQLNDHIVREAAKTPANMPLFQAKLLQSKQQLQACHNQRDQAVVSVVLQSPAIINRLKTMGLFGDIGSVYVMSQRTTIICSQKIRLLKEAISALDMQMDQVLQSLNVVTPDVFYAKVSQINGQAERHRQKLVEMRALRDEEIVRMVQYSKNVRILLTRAMRPVLAAQPTPTPTPTPVEAASTEVQPSTAIRDEFMSLQPPVGFPPASA